MSKTYTPEEVAKAVLNKCQELAEEQKLKKAEIDKCGDMNKEKSPVAKSSHLKNFMEKKKKKADLKKIGGGVQTTGAGGTPLPGSTASTGGPSIASQIGFGKKELKKAKVDEGKSNAEKHKAREERGSKDSPKKRIEGVHKPHFMAGLKTGTSEVGAYQGAGKLSPDTVSNLKQQHKEVSDKAKKIKPNLPKSEDGMATNKAAGLKPLTSDKIKPPSADQMPEKPKAATTLKSYMAKRKK